jgi:hypothetical protein
MLEKIVGILATVLLKVKPGTYVNVHNVLLGQKLKHKMTSGLWDFVAEIRDSDLNCDVPEDYALTEVIDIVRSIQDVLDSNVNVTVGEVSE